MVASGHDAWRAGAWQLEDESLEKILSAARRSRGVPPGRAAWSALRRDRIAIVGLVYLVVLAVVVLLAPLLPLPSPVARELQLEPRAPVWPWVEPVNERWAGDSQDLGLIDAWMVEARAGLFGRMQTGPWLGTDVHGRDVLARLVWGGRTSMLLALAAALASLALGVGCGALAGFGGGRLDAVLMRGLRVLDALPLACLWVLVLSLLGTPGAAEASGSSTPREQVLFLAIGSIGWLATARSVRARLRSLRASPFVQTARVAGASSPRILFAHVLPHLGSTVALHAVRILPGIVVFGALLSFLGLGVEAPRVSLGLLVAEAVEALHPLRVYWWLALFPALTLGSTLLALHVLGAGVHGVLDPEGREEVP